MRLLLAITAFTAATCLGTPAAAQQLWIEQQGGDAKMYFGDFAANLRETSPGLLDTFVQPMARVVSLEGRDIVTMKKLRNAFDLGVRVPYGQALVAQESRYPATETKDGDKVVRTIWIPAARYVPDLSAQETSLALDLYPSVRAGVFKVVFSGQPLVGATVRVAAASGWLREFRSDDRGQVTVDFPWKTTYVMEVRHTDATPGQRPGPNGAEKYDVARFVTTLTYEQGVGSPPLPTPPAAPATPVGKPAR